MALDRFGLRYTGIMSAIRSFECRTGFDSLGHADRRVRLAIPPDPFVPDQFPDEDRAIQLVVDGHVFQFLVVLRGKICVYFKSPGCQSRAPPFPKAAFRFHPLANAPAGILLL